MTESIRILVLCTHNSDRIANMSERIVSALANGRSPTEAEITPPVPTGGER